MTMKIATAVLGGDRRQHFVAKVLADGGCDVLFWGGEKSDALGEGVRLCNSWQEAVEPAQAVILPLPASLDGVRLNAPAQGDDAPLRLSSLLDAMAGKVLLGGKLGEGICRSAQQKGIEVFDYYNSEILQLKNALPTAEGAIMTAMERLPVTIDGAEVCIVGYGRIGRLLGQKLAALGATVTVYARNPEQLTLAALAHHRAQSLQGGEALLRLSKHTRVIFNTVPKVLFTKEILAALPKGCLFVDLASPPGGLDRQAADALGVEHIWATALPGKYAPETAGVILGETVLDILQTQLAPGILSTKKEE